MAKTPVPRVPIQTPVFEQGPDGAQRLTRTWIIFLERLTHLAGGGGPYVRTLLLKDTTVGNDIADHVPIWVAGGAIRAIAVLRKAITADLEIRVNLDGTAVLDIVVPHTTAVDTPVMVDSTAFATKDFGDTAVLSWDVVASDGSTDPAGILSLTVEWQ